MKHQYRNQTSKLQLTNQKIIAFVSEDGPQNTVIIVDLLYGRKASLVKKMQI